MEWQHLDLKLPLAQPAHFEPAALIPVFHGWIREGFGQDLLIDVADYSHVAGGPGVMLIGHEANYSLDCTHHRPGLRYARKTPLEGGNTQRLARALAALAKARRRLEEEPGLNGGLRFNRNELEIRFNDRLLAPNTPESFAALAPELPAFFRQHTGGEAVSLEQQGEPREVLRVLVRSDKPLDEPAG